MRICIDFYVGVWYRPNMPSLQRYSSNGQIYWRIVESFRRPDGKPSVRVLQHLGKAEDLLARLQYQRASLRVHSVSSGAVDASLALAGQLRCADAIDDAVRSTTGALRHRDGLSVGQSILAAAVGRLVHPSSKRAFAEWAAQTSLPARLNVKADVLTSQHFWDQMEALPPEAISAIEQQIVARALALEQIPTGMVAYDTTNFFTHLDTPNSRCHLAQRGHSKQRRHDLRQLGLALMVSEEGQIPLGHVLYEGSRADVRSFHALLQPIRLRLRALAPQPQQLTLIFDQGAESQANLEQARQLGLGYVTALKPSAHRAWLAEDAALLEPVKLSTGKTVRACRKQRLVHGVEHIVITVFSEKLYAGQRRGLDQHLGRALRHLAGISTHPRDGLDGARRQVAKLLNRQYVRQVLRCEVSEQNGQVLLRPWIDEESRAKLEKEYFGLRLLATSRHDWSTAQIIEAYRGQARVEGAFRDLKDPWVCAFRPQYHWTDQKLLVHALIVVLSLLLGRILLRRAQLRHGFKGSLRTLIKQLSHIRTCTVIEQQPGRGRPQVRQQAEHCDPELKTLGEALATW